MAHPLVDQLRFARDEFVRGLADVKDPQAQQRFGSINCISWIIGHLAWQEQRYWLTRAQGQMLLPQLNELLAYGKPACTPPVEEMWAAWRQITAAADPWLDALTVETIQAPLTEGLSSSGTFLQRNLYHYWYHLGEGMAIRQMLGHTSLPDFVGNIDGLAPYRPEAQAQPTQMSKAELIHKVRAAREQVNQLVNQLNEADMLQPFKQGGWSIKDILAHLTWHEREMLGVLRKRALVGSDLWTEPTDKRNQVIYEQNRDLPLNQVHDEAEQVFQELLRELDGLEDDDLHDPNRFAQFPPDWRPWQLLAENTYEHYLAHLPELQDVLMKTGRSA